jgi:hypothetical protein
MIPVGTRKFKNYPRPSPTNKRARDDFEYFVKVLKKFRHSHKKDFLA